MTTTAPTDATAQLRRALMAMEKAQARIDALERAKAEPIAIIGIGCRFPGAASPEQLWALLSGGGDAITEVPPERWDINAYYDSDPDAPGKMYTRWGGFLGGIDQFDNALFEIAPREAASMDPQQRLLLEVSWEALESAGQLPQQLMGTQTGVFVGISGSEYAAQLLFKRDASEIDLYASTGSFVSVAAGRLSYVFGLTGPAVAVDTACSSSLVAAHLACQSLRAGECHLALVGGVNLVLSPEHTIVGNRMRALSADGRCRSFDAGANGFVRADGCGVVVLKRLSDALRDRDPVAAVIKGSAVNQDGRSNGLTAPNGHSQEAVIRQALDQARVVPALVGYVEAHGTGTPLGDPIEMHALGAVFGEGRTAEAPLIVGAIKTNIGHAEAAAGVAGLIKAALIVQHARIPPNLHFSNPSPHIAWDQLPVKVPTEMMPWPNGGPRRIAGVSSFGISGTNAHVVVEGAPPEDVRPPPGVGPRLLVLSAATAEGLRQQALRFVDHLRQSGAISLADICYTAAMRRGPHAHRLALIAESAEQTAGDLAAFAKGERRPGQSQGVSVRPRRKIAFVFPGQGGQWAGMGRALLAEEPVFRASVEECARVMRGNGLIDWSLVDVLRGEGEGGEADLQRVDVIQPAVFALQVGLAAVWRSWGVEPGAVVGHSMGEVAAAHVAGGISLEDGCRIICLRSQLVRRVSGQGGMAVVELSAQEAEEAIAWQGGKVSIAAMNSPRTTVLSGEREGLGSVLAALEERGVFYRWVKVDYASHSVQMDSLRAELMQRLGNVTGRRTTIPMYSTVTGERSGEALLEGGCEYWARNLREPVRFWPAIEGMVRDGFDTFVELNGHPTLLPSIEEGLRAAMPSLAAVASLRREEGGRSVLLGRLGELYTSGYAVNWARQYPEGGKVVSLPHYPWQRSRHWVEPRKRRREGGVAGLHPLMGQALGVAQGGSGMRVWQRELDLDDLPYLRDHVVGEATVFPASAYVEMAATAGKEVYREAAFRVEELSLEEALTFEEGKPRTVQVVANEQESGVWSLRVSSLGGEGGGWTKHAGATLRAGRGDEPAQGDGLAEARARCATEIDRAGYYQRLRGRGLSYGAAFEGVARIWSGSGEAVGEVELPGGAGDATAYSVHPALLDGCLQVILAAIPGSDENQGPMVPVRLHATTCTAGQVGRRAWAHARVIGEPGNSGQTTGDKAGQTPGETATRLVADVRVFDETGQVVVSLRGIVLQGLEGAQPRQEDLFLMHEWRAAPVLAVATGEPAGGATPSCLVLADEGGYGERVAEALRRRGISVVSVQAREIELASPQSFERLLGQQTFGSIVHLWSLDGPAGAATDLASLERARVRDCGAALHLVQAVARLGLRDVPRLWLVTRGVHAPDGDARDAEAADDARDVRDARDLEDASQSPAASMLWGLGRTIANEHPELRATRVDVGAGVGAGAAAGAGADLDVRLEVEIAALAEEIAGGGREEEILLRGERRWVGRLVRRTPVSTAREISVAANGQPFRLEIDQPGVLDRLVLRRAARRPLAAGEVDIEVAATGLNFRDVLQAMGVISDRARPEGASSPSLGFECAGRVVAVGAGVTRVSVGQEVLAIASGALGSFVTTAEPLVVAKPANLSAEEGATLLVAHVTAYYALAHVARLSRGERVLIHAATGGVGLAAVQWAQHVGAEVFATAGSPEKREYLRVLGVSRVSDSRSARFAEEILDWTNGEGIDVVLNSLSGELIEKSFGLLRSDGRFVEIGVRDYLANAQLGLRPFLKNLSYTLVDLLGMTRRKPARINAVIGEVMALVEQGILRPLPHRTFPIMKAAEAFRTMAQARHIGKLVIKVAETGTKAGVELGAEPRVMERAQKSVAIRAEGTYLLTGGLGGLGLSVARELVERGARHLVLVGRRGADSEAQKQAVAELRTAGAEVVVAAADVASRAEMEGVFQRMAAEGLPPLSGVVHAAGVIDDRLLQQQDLARFASVMGAKVAGTWNLHELTRSLALDFFVLYSSGASLLGSAGQGNYAAANSFLDAVAHYRRALGLPGLSINWGAFSEVGLAAAQDNRAARLERQGLRSLTPVDGTRLLMDLLATGEAQVGVMPMDFRHWVSFAPHLASSTLLSDLVRDARPAGRGGDRALREALLAAPEEARRALLTNYLVQQVGQVTRTDPAQIDASTPFKNLGIDSLMGLELRNRLEAGLGLKLSATLIWTYPTAVALAQYIGGKMAPAPVPLPAPSPAASVASSPSAPVPAQVAAGFAGRPVAELSQDETERRLVERLAALEDRLR